VVWKRLVVVWKRACRKVRMGRSWVGWFMIGLVCGTSVVDMSDVLDFSAYVRKIRWKARY